MVQLLEFFLKQKLANKPLTIVGNGKQTRDFVHVKDVVRAFYLAAISKFINKIYNLGSGRTVTVNKLAYYIGGKKILFQKDQVSLRVLVLIYQK